MIPAEQEKPRWWRAFLLGAASAFDIAPVPSPEVERILARSDTEALAADWRAVGDDFRRVMATFEVLDDRPR